MDGRAEFERNDALPCPVLLRAMNIYVTVRPGGKWWSGL